MKYLVFILFSAFIAFTGTAQQCNFRLSGHVEDEDTKDKLVGAVVRIEQTGLSLVTDDKGDFVFNGLCKGEYTLLITHVSCDPVEKKLSLTKDYHLDILMPHARRTLGQVVVEAQKGFANTGFKKEISRKNLEETKGLSLAEALSKINGVTMLQTGSTIAKPVIHGLHSSRILTINNGVRQEGQQWGNEHAPEIDPFIADKLIVVKGVDELKYGSDAIGGVILVEPKPLRSKPGYMAEINSAYFTNNQQYVASAVFEQQLLRSPGFKYRIQGTFKRGANATTPNYRLNNTGSEEKNFSLTAALKKEKFNTEIFYSHFATKLGIFTGSHIGNLTDLQNAIAASRPNDVFLGEQTYTIRRPYQDVSHHLLKSKTIFYRRENKFTLQIAGQFNHRKEFDIVRNSTNKNPQLDLSILTLSEDFNWESPRKNGFSSLAGIAMMQQDNSYSGRYFIPNYFSYSFGGFFIEKWSKHEWDLQAGIRYDNKSINTTRLKFNGDTLNYDFNFSTLATSVNLAYTILPGLKVNSNFSLASRAPYVNELLSDGIHHGTATYEKGDINLKPEQSFNISLGLNYQGKQDKLLIELLLYSNSIRDFIYQQPKPDNPVLTIAGAFPLIQYEQTDAVLSGIDLGITLKPVTLIGWTSKLSILRARNKQLNDWLILMPANRLSNEVSLNFRKWKSLSDSYISIELMSVAQQKNIPSDINGKQDYKLPPDAYNLLSVNASTTIQTRKLPITLSIGVRNLLNTVYRDYLNSMRYFSDEMGRNINFRIKLPLESTHRN